MVENRRPVNNTTGFTGKNNHQHPIWHFFGSRHLPAHYRLPRLLQEIPQVVVRIDDILVTGKTRKNHLEHLKEVLVRLDKTGIRLKLKKRVFVQNQVIYLGHRINRDGI